MSDISIRLEFQGKDDFQLSLDETKLTAEVPEWAQLSHISCPGNHLHGPEIDYCRLSCQLQHLVSYFDDIRSFDKGILYIYEGADRQEKICEDAQGIFFHIVFLLLSNTSCSVFVRDQNFRRHYRLSADPQDIFYTYFSIFLVDSFLHTPSRAVDLDKLKDELKLEISVLDNLIRRLNTAATEGESDASRNGLVIFEAVLKLMGINFDKYLDELKKQ